MAVVLPGTQVAPEKCFSLFKRFLHCPHSPFCTLWKVRAACDMTKVVGCYEICEEYCGPLSLTTVDVFCIRSILLQPSLSYMSISN